MNLCRNKMLYEKSQLVWNQVRHIAETLDKNGRKAWNTAAIGSDFDGIVDPLNGFWSSEDFPSLAENLLLHASEYIHNSGKKLTIPENRYADPEEIIFNVMCNNIMSFLYNHYE